MATPEEPLARLDSDQGSKKRADASDERIDENENLRDKDRDRSRSPPRKTEKKSFSKGFNWKKKTVKDVDEGSTRGYGNQEDYRPKRHGGKDDRDKFVERNRERDRDSDKTRDRDYRGDRTRDHDRNNDSQQNQSRGEGKDEGRRRNDKNRHKSDRDSKPKKEKKTPSAGNDSANTEFIVVTVNDRLGTKARIPCLPSDTIGEFSTF